MLKRQRLTLVAIAVVSPLIAYGAIILTTPNPVTPVSASEPAKTEPLERIPFTNKPVTPGDPESYIGTYGQCPFYENAGEKGCYPPSDIVCNADWSVCKPKSEVENVTSEPNDSRSTPSKEEQPSGCFSSK